MAKSSSSGLSKTDNTQFKLNSRNLQDYNLRLAKKSSKVSAKELNTALDTINQLNELLNLDKSNLPKLYLEVGTKQSSYGVFTYFYDEAEYRIRLTQVMFDDKNYDTAAHEYTHALVAQASDNILADFSPRDRYNAMADIRASKEICYDALLKLNKKYEGASAKSLEVGWKEHANTIKLHSYDDYASSRQDETITRAVQMVLREKNGTLSVNGGKASPYAHAVVNTLKEYIHEAYKMKTHTSSKKSTSNKASKKLK